MDPDRRVVLSQLQAAVSSLRGAPRLSTGATLPERHTDLPSGLVGLPRWPRPGLIELSGRPGSGRLGLWSPAAALLTRQGAPVAVVDPLGRLYPPGLVGLRWERLLLLQPAAEQAAWAAEQLAQSGAFPLVVLLDPPRLGKAGARLERAAERGECALFIVNESVDLHLPASLRVQALGRRGERLSVALRRAQGEAEGRRLEVGGAAPGA